MMGIDLRSATTKVTSLLVCTAMLLQLVSCGTLLYPERRGQKSGELDLAVVLMDGIGLFFFIIPGLIAFAVDIHTGAIYLPPGHPRGKGKRGAATGEIVVMQADPKSLNSDTLSAMITAKTGFPVRLDDPNLIILKANRPIHIADELKRISHIYLQ